MHVFGFFLLPEYKSVDDCEELVINAATTINNLSYYKTKSSAVHDKKLHIAESEDFLTSTFCIAFWKWKLFMLYFNTTENKTLIVFCGYHLSGI